MDEDRCFNCFYWISENVHGFGRCHRNPPSVSGDRGQDFPSIDGSQWCGEFKPKIREVTDG